MESTNPNITPEGNFTLTYFPDQADAEPQTPLEAAIQYLFDCWNYEEVYRPWTRKTKKRLLRVINNVLLPACEEGNQDAIHWMYFAYIYGLGVEQDYEKELEYLKRLAECGYPDIQRELGIRYYDINEGRMRRKAVRLFMKAAKHGDAEAMYMLADCYASMYGVRQSDRKAFLWYRRAAKRGHEEAMWRLGLYYQRGIGVKKNLAMAAEWYEKAGAYDKARKLRNGEDDYAVDKYGIVFCPSIRFENDELFNTSW